MRNNLLVRKLLMTFALVSKPPIYVPCIIELAKASRNAIGFPVDGKQSLTFLNLLYKVFTNEKQIFSRANLANLLYMRSTHSNQPGSAASRRDEFYLSSLLLYIGYIQTRNKIQPHQQLKEIKKGSKMNYGHNLNYKDTFTHLNFSKGTTWAVLLPG